jgi:oligopeptide transport system permease protein
MTAPQPLLPPKRFSTESPWRAAGRRLVGNARSVAGLAFLGFLALFCIVGPMVSPYKQTDQELDNKTAAPSARHWMGTDALGRDVMTRVMYGGRVSLLVGFVATGVAVVIGVLYGMISGLAGGRTDAALMRAVDILYAFPFMNFVIILTAVLGSHPTLLKLEASIMEALAVFPSMRDAATDIGFNASFLLLFAAIGAVEWLTMARVVRGQVLSLKNQEFVVAARGYGARTPRILFKHLLPNVIGPVIVYASLTVPGVMLLEATLSFLGLGIQPPASSWGALIMDGAQQMGTAPWLLLFPGLFFSFTLLALNFVGDGLRDALDPKSGS